ncbi:MAG: hypothetical protein KBA26_03460 [Candidatus Delongbacteria bacterium]|nr:hypothetical protein [Candidatus Delongbacteria bacterium]
MAIKKIRRLGVLSVAKLYGILTGLIGLLAGVMLAIVGSVMKNLSPSLGMISDFGMAAVIVMPIIYGLIGFIVGAVIAWIYNLLAGLIGGIEVDLEDPPTE